MRSAYSEGLEESETLIKLLPHFPFYGGHWFHCIMHIGTLLNHVNFVVLLCCLFIYCMVIDYNHFITIHCHLPSIYLMAYNYMDMIIDQYDLFRMEPIGVIFQRRIGFHKV